MRIALVGPTGVLGRALVPLLLERGHHVRALARTVAKVQELFPPQVDAVACDLLAPGIGDQLPAMLDGCDAIAHIATAIPADASAPDAWTANSQLRTIGVRLLLDAALAAGVINYVQQSITMAYPDCGDRWITEETPLDTAPERAGIAGTVIVMEGMVRAIRPEQMAWSILRGAIFVGPGTFQARAIEELRAGTATVACDGSNYVSLVHVNDMATAVAAALEQGPAQGVFNIVAEPLREGEYRDRLAAAAGAPRPRREAAIPCPPSWRCSNQAARKGLGWQPKWPVVPPGRLQPGLEMQ